MSHTVLLVLNKGIYIDILYTLEYVALHKRIGLLECCYELLDLLTLGLCLLIVAGGTCIRELTCTLYKMKFIIIPPRLDVVFPYHIKRSDELHALKVGAVKLRHHSLHLCPIEHAHKYGLYDIIIVMSKCYLVAAKLLCITVQMTTSHPGTEITR